MPDFLPIFSHNVFWVAFQSTINQGKTTLFYFNIPLKKTLTQNIG